MEVITNKNFFSENYIIDAFLFITVIISLLATTLTVYLLCKHKKLRMIMASLALNQVKEVGTVTKKEINTECKTLTYISLASTILGLVMIATFVLQKIKIVQRMHVLYCSENHDIHFRCTILYTYKIYAKP